MLRLNLCGIFLHLMSGVLGAFAPCVLYGSNMERMYPAENVFRHHCLIYSGLYFLGVSLFNSNNLAPCFSVGSRIALRRKYNLEVCACTSKTWHFSFAFPLSKLDCDVCPGWQLVTFKRMKLLGVAVFTLLPCWDFLLRLAPVWFISTSKHVPQVERNYWFCMQNNHWELVGDQLLAEGPIELKDNSNEVILLRILANVLVFEDLWDCCGSLKKFFPTGKWCQICWLLRRSINWGAHGALRYSLWHIFACDVSLVCSLSRRPWASSPHSPPCVPALHAYDPSNGAKHDSSDVKVSQHVILRLMRVSESNCPFEELLYWQRAERGPSSLMIGIYIYIYIHICK